MIVGSQFLALDIEVGQQRASQHGSHHARSSSMGIEWRLRQVMAQRNMWRVTDLIAALPQAGLSDPQVYKLVSQRPERLSLRALDTLCQALDCQPGDLLHRTDVP